MKLRAGKFKPGQILITGHSLGGALTKICALDLAMNRIDGTENIKIKVITMGEPRVGNEHFKNTFQENVKDHMRLLMNWDVVPKTGYLHKKKFLVKFKAKKFSLKLENAGDGSCKEIQISKTEICL